jgi:hypothetical protein
MVLWLQPSSNRSRNECSYRCQDRSPCCCADRLVIDRAAQTPGSKSGVTGDATRQRALATPSLAISPRPRLTLLLCRESLHATCAYRCKGEIDIVRIPNNEIKNGVGRLASASQDRLGREPGPSCEIQQPIPFGSRDVRVAPVATPVSLQGHRRAGRAADFAGELSPV